MRRLRKLGTVGLHTARDQHSSGRPALRSVDGGLTGGGGALAARFVVAEFGDVHAMGELQAGVREGSRAVSAGGRASEKSSEPKAGGRPPAASHTTLAHLRTRAICNPC